MNCPRCREPKLTSILTEKGIEVDSCDQCHGVWLDKGELLLFARHPKELEDQIRKGLKEAGPSLLMSPKTGRPMQAFTLEKAGLRLDRCPESLGIWFDGGKLKRLLASPLGLTGLTEDPRVGHDESPLGAIGLRALPNLELRSCAVLFSLYALLVLGLIVVAEILRLPAHFPLLAGIFLIALQFLIAPVMLDLSLRWAHRMRWVGLEDLPKDLADSVQKICREQKIRVPHLGVIQDGNPNAFTYGHTPRNARLILTRGILDLLKPPEIEAVVAHEVGHIQHWDMAVMTAAQLVPLVFYYLYRICLESRGRPTSHSRSEDKGEAGRLIVALGAFILYVISEFIVLWLSRTRELFADRFAGRVIGNPNALASALVKIAYGMAGQEPAQRKETVSRSANLEAVGAMGLFDPKAARALAVVGAPLGLGKQGLGGPIDREALKQVMRWDRWNPWAKLYELQSTHPLVANRLHELGELSASMNQEPFVLFNFVKPESYWDEFFVDLVIRWLPALGTLLGFFLGWESGSPLLTLVFPIFGLGAGMLLQIPFQYPSGHFPEMSIVSLLKQVKVSAVRPVPCTLKGTVIGRGIPGLIWSEDFVIKDGTGILFLDYTQPLSLWEFLFGLLRGRQLQGEPVTVTGWYRRAPVPYLEVFTLTTKAKTYRSYTRVAKGIGSTVLVLLGLALLIWGLT